MPSNGWLSLTRTAIVLLTYAFIFSAVFVTDQLPKVPRNTRELDVNEAWSDLHVITASPHPYNSHANDLVRTYLLTRLKTIVAAYPYVHLSDDLQSNGTWDDTYFEGTNILVKIDGTDPGADAVLFSAHYDSVSTANGATDDGMAIVTLLQLVKKFSKKRHRRTAIFNFNNGEEDFLNGAHAFLRHPWSNFTSTFLNLEGAASGGRPLLFRSTSTTPLRSFLPFHVSRPHTNVLAADAFNHGLIRSETDYVVYEADHRMEGLDLAFYKGRSRYHTRYDAIPWLEGQERALWAMMENADGAGDALLSMSTKKHERTVMFEKDAVYFDLFGRIIVLFSLDKLRIYNIVFLATAPVGTALLVVCKRKSTANSERSNKWFTFGWIKFWVALLLTAAAQVFLVFFVTRSNPFIVYSSSYWVLLSALALAYLTFSVSLSVTLPQKWSRPQRKREDRANSLLFQLVILSYIFLFLPTVFFTPIGGTYPLSALATCAFAGWAVGIIREIMFTHRQELATSTEAPIGPNEEEELEASPASGSTSLDRRRESFRQGRSQEGPWNGGSAPQVETTAEEETGEATETTPLIQAPHRHLKRFSGLLGSSERWRFWVSMLRKVTLEGILSVQFLLVVPIPVTLFAHIIVLLIGALPQSITDGGPVWIAYAALSALSVFIVLPIVPFIPSPSGSPVTPGRNIGENFGFNRSSSARPFFRLVTITFILIVTFLSGFFGITLTKSFPQDQRIGFPFSVEEPLKVYFEQKVELLAEWRTSDRISTDFSDMTQEGPEARSRTYLVGIPKYVDKYILPALPSAQRADSMGKLDCVQDKKRQKLLRCGWDSGENMLPVPGEITGDVPHSMNDETEELGLARALVLERNPWLKSSLMRDEATHVKVTLGGKNTRGCRVYFDEDGAKVKTWRVAGGTGVGTAEDESGIRMVKLWSRTWGREFVLDLEVEAGKKLRGKVACEWVEYESGLTGVPYAGGEVNGAGIIRASTLPRLPAYEEAFSFLPRWAVTTKGADGLAEVSTSFSI